MKSFARNSAFHAFSLFLTAAALSGINVSGGVITYIVAGLALSIIEIIVRPIANIVTFPLRFLSFGSLSFLLNGVMLYILTVLVQQITVREFTFAGASLLGIIVPRVHLNLFFAYLAAAALMYGTFSFLQWLTK